MGIVYDFGPFGSPNLLGIMVVFGLPGGSVMKNPLPMQEIWVWSLGEEDPVEEEIVTLQYSCLENPLDRGAWQTIVHGVTKSQTQLSMHAW